ncbi:hypothetical protein HK405_013530 [Cladochytrium tenue]|nr:hypothetical protein HK405_013530 [Cladochytrium tenue]
MEPEAAQPMSENTDSTPVDRQLTPVQKTVKPEIRPLGPDEVAADLSKWFRKMYLGGFRDKRTGVEYFHAFSQTPTAQELKDAKAAPKFHRDTQTKYERNRLSQSTKETATQMTKSGVYVTSEKDCIIVPRAYFSAEEYHRMIVRKVIVIQCFVRKCFALRLVRKLREDRDRRLKALAAKELRRRQLAEKRRKKELESRLHPKTAKDFEILYNGLENWRIQEIEKINRAGYSEPARLAALADLMDQEAVLIQKIDKLRQSAMEENREKAIAKLLEQMASPKKWPVYKGGYVSVDTPDTIRARELRDLYHAVNVAQVSVDERLQILLHVKYTVKEFDCSLTREIVELIDREGDLMSRGRDPKTMEEAGQAWKRDQAVYYCRGCTKYLPSTEFYLSTTMKHLGRCKRCTQNENMANHRKDDSVYADMLKDVRQQEAKRRARGWGFGGDVGDVDVDDAHYNAMNLLQESDMRYLVEVVWGRQSCVSGARSLEDLCLTRWDARHELSPWNCVLLTRSEAERHDAAASAVVGGVTAAAADAADAASPERRYADEFVRQVRQRHAAARRYFAQLPAMEKYIARRYVEDAGGRLMPVRAAAGVAVPAVGAAGRAERVLVEAAGAE